MQIKTISCVLLLVPLLSATQAQANDEENAKKLIKELYTYSLSSFEFAEFENRMNLKAHCELLKQYFLEDLVKQPTLNSGCILSPLFSVRYPALRLEDAGSLRASSSRLKADFSSAQIVANEVAVDVLTHRAKSVYFLKKMDEEWRIVNALVFENWPIGGGQCRSSFLAAPTKEQKKLELSECRAQRLKS